MMARMDYFSRTLFATCTEVESKITLRGPRPEQLAEAGKGMEDRRKYSVGSIKSRSDSWCEVRPNFSSRSC